jgi:serine/threonine-protein kinase
MVARIAELWSSAVVSVAQVRDRLAQSDLLASDTADRRITEWQEVAGESEDGAALVRWLVRLEELTEFQADALLAGHAGPYMLGPYRVFERMAAGWLGNIFRAVHEDFQQPVALKVFPSTLAKSPEKLARLGREARVSIEVDHPNVVRTFQVGHAGDVYFLAVEDLHGETLATRLAREKMLPFYDACRLLCQAAMGLEYLHSQGIVHRDVQPANLWITPGGVMKIMEFGAARDALEFLDTSAEGENPTIKDEIVGTFDYMAPEQAEDAHAADAQSDIYSLGCTLYRCLTGQPPFPDTHPVRQMLRHAHEPLKPVTDLAPEVPMSLAEAVAVMLAKRPEERYKHARDVAWELEQHVEAQDLELEEQRKVNPDYLQWVRSAEGRATTGFGSVVASPECAEFVGWLAEQYGTGR